LSKWKAWYPKTAKARGFGKKAAVSRDTSKMLTNELSEEINSLKEETIENKAVCKAEQR